MTQNIMMQLRQATNALLQQPTTAAIAKTNNKRLSPVLIAAVAAALPAASHAADPGEWSIDTAILYYTESDRVQAIEPVISATRGFEDGQQLNLKLVADSLSGPSPTGAVPSSIAQTYSRPSGRDTYVVSAGEIPLDDTFIDTRIAGSAGWSQPLWQNWTGNVGLNISNEYDYFSAAVNGGLSYDFNKKNSNVGLALSYAQDTIEPEGNVPLAGACMVQASATNGCTQTTFEQTRITGSENKDVLDAVVNYSQVLSKTAIAQFSYSLSQSSGYHIDPFKIVSVVDTDNSVGNGVGEAERHIYENRPDSRTKHALFSRVKKQLWGRDVLDASYRYSWDDWGLSSHTIDLHYRWNTGNHYWQPRLRWYSQSAVDFYHAFLRDDQPQPEFFTADYRQGNFDAYTLGLEYGHRFGDDKLLQVALEYYHQAHEQPGDRPGQLANQDVVPDLDAVMLRVNFNFDW